MLTFKLGYGPGQWKPLLGSDQKRSAIIKCPECGDSLPLLGHTIDPTGLVSPSIGHDLRFNACSWHANILLEGWQGS